MIIFSCFSNNLISMIKLHRANNKYLVKEIKIYKENYSDSIKLQKGKVIYCKNFVIGDD